jgi:hypothetical protein
MTSLVRPIRYDVNIDLKIIKLLQEADLFTLNITQLKEKAVSTTETLDIHLHYLKQWQMIYDQRPTRNGKARKISLTMPYFDAIDRLLELKHSLETVNERFTTQK